MRAPTGAPAESGDGRQCHAEELNHRLASLVSAEEACRAIQQDFPALQMDAAEARNAIRNLRVTVGMATSGGLAADRDQTRAVGEAPEGWITLQEAVVSLRDRNGYAPEDRWLHKAKGRGLLVDPATWRMCRVRRDGGERQAICIPKRWIEVAAPHLKTHVRNVDWCALGAALTKGLRPPS